MYRPLAHKFHQFTSRSRPVVGQLKSFNQFSAGAASSVLQTTPLSGASLHQDQFKSSPIVSPFTQQIRVEQPSRKMSTEGAAGGHDHTNRLANERSTYLLQHAHNPVDWYPWGEEAIAKARAENKLIFLSVGYSTCHWCHVMEKESFENPDIAELMNRYFVNIKVDREERPDLDRLYMNFVVMINGSGGWPMSVWLTPDLAPISAGTYFPPVDRWGTPGFTSVLKMVHGKWTNDKESLTRVGLRVIDVMRQSTPGQCSSDCSILSTEAKFNEAVQIFYRNVDPEWGGFGRAPKFPEVSKLNFLLHANTHKPDADALSVPLDTLIKIAEGGIHDHIFGGFARYSVDRKWHVPHFEKMLYDQGQLMQAYANSYKIKRNPLFLEVADNIFRYIIKDLHHPEGAFYSGEDADSYPQLGDAEKIEGAFYAWEWQELKDIFDENRAKFQHAESFDIFCHYYGIEEEGNVESSSDPQGHLLTKNILMIQTTLEKVAEKYKMDVDTVSTIVKQFHEILHDIRDRRPRPHLDTKIITSWNGLMLSGISKLAAVSVDLERQVEYKQVAADLVEFIRKHLYDAESKTIFRTCYGDGVDSATSASLGKPISGFLDDYAFLIKGLLDYYLVSLDPEILRWARELQNTQDRLFWDSEHHGYFFSHENAENVVVRLKDDHDGAEPCGNSVATNNLLLLHGYFEEEAFQTKASQVFEFYAKTTPFGYMLPEMMSAMLLFDTGSPLIVIVGHSDADLVKEFVSTVHSFFIPGLVLIQHDPAQPDRTTRKSSKELKMVNNLPAAHICINQSCELPISTVAELRAKLSETYLFN